VLVKNGPESTLDADLLWDLWEGLTGMYGNRFTGTYGIEPHDVWACELFGMTATDLAKGMETCAKIGADRVKHGEEDWPPSANEFRQYCVGSRQAAHREFLRLPIPKNNLNSPAYREFRRAMGWE